MGHRPRRACAGSSIAATIRPGSSPSSRKSCTSRAASGTCASLEEAHPEGLPGNVGIGHTRWATHGGVTEANCHPHLDSKDRIAIVHNGIIDNVEALRAELRGARSQLPLRNRHRGAGRADRARRRVGPRAARRRRRARSSASRARRASSRWIEQDPERLVAARMGSPVVIGLGEGACWSRPTLSRSARTPTAWSCSTTARWPSSLPIGIKTVDLEQRSREKRIEKILHQPEDADLGDFAHFMLKEIHEQPAALDRSMRGRLDAVVGSSRLGGLADARAAAVRHPAGGVLRLRDQPVQRGGRRVPDEPLRAHAGRGRRRGGAGRQKPDRRPPHAVRRDLTERRDGRHAGRAARDQPARRTGCGHHQRGRQLAFTRDGFRRLRACWARRSASARRRRSPRRCWPRSCLALRFARMRDLAAADGRAWVRALEQLPAAAAVDAGACRRVRGAGRALPRRALHACSSGAASTCRWPARAR